MPGLSGVHMVSIHVISASEYRYGYGASERGGMSRRQRVIWLVAAVGLLATVAVASNDAISDAAETPESVDRATSMKIGLLLNFSGSPETAADRKRAFDLAIQHINDAGGVLGRRVEGVWADATLDPNRAVEEAWRLVEAEGIHALVGPNASAAALPVAETIAGSARIPTISQSATSPQLTVADDDDYFFRVALSDVAQGPVLARVTRERGFDSVGLIYRGRSLRPGAGRELRGRVGRDDPLCPHRSRTGKLFARTAGDRERRRTGACRCDLRSAGVGGGPRSDQGRNL